MEEAYAELYREFIGLRSLCLKQAALLQQLTEALQNRQGPSVPNGGFVNMVSIPVQCIRDASAPLHDGPEPLIATTRNPRAQHGSEGPPRGAGTFSDLLAEDMGRLGLDVPNPRENQRLDVPNPRENQRLDVPNPRENQRLDVPNPRENQRLDVPNPRENQRLDVPNPRENQRQAVHSVRDETLHMFRMPWACTSTQHSDFLNQAGGVMMSELALQSQVCDFCPAVFPGHTTTRGEYLRHLHTHIT